MTHFRVVSGDLLKGEHHVIVNAVNCVGVMGAGVAKVIREACGEEYFRAYEHDCKTGRLRMGGMSTWHTSLGRGRKSPPKNLEVVINFPTMQIPGGTVNPAALRASIKEVRDLMLMRSCSDWGDAEQSIGIPALGCGIGDFTFHDLIPLVKHGLDGVEGLIVSLYQPR